MAVDRKQQMKEITERLEQGVKDIFTSEMYTTYLRTMAKFHNYSFNNTLLIAMQRPDATLVAGFNAWKNKFKANHYIVSPPDTFVLFWSSHSIILLHFIVAKQLPISRRRSAANTFMWSQIAKI